MPNRTYRFCATIEGPGFIDTAPVWARSHFEAQRLARADLGRNPYKGYPPAHRRSVAVNPEYEAVRDTDGAEYTRQQWETKVRARMALERGPTLGTGLRMLAQLVEGRPHG